MSEEYLMRRRAAVRAFREQERQNQRHPDRIVSPLQVAMCVGQVRSSSTIYNWLKEPVSRATLRRNLSRRGRHRLLTEAQEYLIIGHAIHRRSEFLAVQAKDLIMFSRKYLNVTLSQPYISVLLKRYGWSSQKTMTRSSRLVSDQVVDDAMKAIVELRGRGYAPEHTYVMDETGLWSNVMQPHTYSPVGRYALTAFPKTPIFVHIFPKMGNYPIFVFTSLSRLQLPSPSILYPVLTLSSGNAVVEELGDRFRDTMIAVVRADGCKLPPFFIKGQYGNARKDSGRRPAPGAKPVRGVNNANIVQWIAEFMEHIREPSILLWDRLAVHKSKATIEEIESYVFEDGSPAVEVMLLPPQTAFLLSQLDMGGFAEFKKYYYAFDRSTYE